MTTTIRRLIQLNPTLFDERQAWYTQHAFVNRTLPDDAPVTMPLHAEPFGTAPDDGRWLPLAVTLLHLYVQHPTHPLWRGGWIWCSDLDDQKQRVYIGLNEQGKMQLHRHLALTSNWRVVTWV